MQRRTLLKHSLSTAAVTALGAEAFAAATANAADEKRYTFCTFTKPVQHLSYEETAAAIGALGFDGVEAPVRPKGQVEPERVEEDLPKFIAALKAKGLEMTVLTSGINEVSEEQRTEAVLRTAAAQTIFWPAWPAGASAVYSPSSPAVASTALRLPACHSS